VEELVGVVVVVREEEEEEEEAERHLYPYIHIRGLPASSLLSSSKAAPPFAMLLGSSTGSTSMFL